MIGTDDARCLVLWQWVVMLRNCCCAAPHRTCLHPNYHSDDSFSRLLLRAPETPPPVLPSSHGLFGQSIATDFSTLDIEIAATDYSSLAVEIATG